MTGLLVSSRPDLVKKAGIVAKTIKQSHLVLNMIVSVSEGIKDDDDIQESEKLVFDISRSASTVSGSEVGGAELWALAYHLLLYLQVLLTGPLGNSSDQVFQASVVTVNSIESTAMEVIQEALLYPHLWVRIAASR